MRTIVNIPEAPLQFDDIEVGTVMKSTMTYEVTADEIKEVGRRWDPMPFHVDEAAGAASIFGGLVGSGGHSIMVSIRLGADEEPRTDAIAGLGIDDLRFRRPLRPGDRLSQTTEIVEKRPSDTRRDAGIVRGRRILRNQNGDEVLTYVVTWMVSRAGAG